MLNFVLNKCTLVLFDILVQRILLLYISNKLKTRAKKKQMKRDLLICSFFCFAFNSLAQQDTVLNKKKCYYGINISQILPIEIQNIFEDGVAVIPSLNIIKNKHKFFIGPVIYPENFHHSAKINNHPKLIEGLSILYQFFPLPGNKLLNFYYSYDFRIDYDYGVVNEVGYGFRLNFLKNTYVNNSFTIGTYSDGGAVFDFYNADLSATLKFGVGYIFN